MGMIVGKEPVAGELRLVGIKVPLGQMINPAIVKDACTLGRKRNILKIVHRKENFRVKTGSLFDQIGNHFIRCHAASGLEFVLRAVCAEVGGFVSFALAYRIESGNEMPLTF